MFASGPNYNKLKTNLRLACNRLKLLEKKKTELAQKSRKEIGDYLTANKPDRARIRVEHIIREDYLVEAMEVLEMFCDLILARFGLVQQIKELDDGISEAVSSIIWITPRLQADVPELKIVSDILTSKYGKAYADYCRSAIPPANVSEKLQHKMCIQAPPKLLVEQYLIEIAKTYNIEYEPDPQVMREDQHGPGGTLIDFNDRNNLDGGIPGPPGFVDYPMPPALPILPHPPTNAPFNYPTGPGGNFGGGQFNQQPMSPGQYPGQQPPMNPYGGPMQYPGSSYIPGPAPFNYNIPPNSGFDEKKDLNINAEFLKEEKGSAPPPSYSSLNNQSPEDNMQNAHPKPQPRSKLPGDSSIPILPNVPSTLPDPPQDNEVNDEIDFDDLSRRFEELKKRH